MFILISAWRYTSVFLPADERLAVTMKTSAVSITITSVTDALAFCIGEKIINIHMINMIVQYIYTFARTAK